MRRTKGGGYITGKDNCPKSAKKSSSGERTKGNKKEKNLSKMGGRKKLCVAYANSGS